MGRPFFFRIRLKSVLERCTLAVYRQHLFNICFLDHFINEPFSISFQRQVIFFPLDISVTIQSLSIKNCQGRKAGMILIDNEAPKKHLVSICNRRHFVIKKSKVYTFCRLPLKIFLFCVVRDRAPCSFLLPSVSIFHYQV